jgi:hypothetical protein
MTLTVQMRVDSQTVCPARHTFDLLFQLSRSNSINYLLRYRNRMLLTKAEVQVSVHYQVDARPEEAGLWPPVP